MVAPGIGLEDPLDVEVPDDDLAEPGQHDRTDDDDHRVDESRPAAAQARSRPVLPPQGDHRDHWKGKRRQRAENEQRGLRPTERDAEQEERGRDDQQTDQPQLRLALEPVALAREELMVVGVVRREQRRAVGQRRRLVVGEAQPGLDAAGEIGAARPLDRDVGQGPRGERLQLGSDAARP